MVGFFAASLCFLVVSLAGALQVDIPQDEYEYARGDNISLPCVFKAKKVTNTLIIAIWTVDTGDPEIPERMILTHYSTGQTDVPPPYEGRATVDFDPKGKADLKLKGITLQDNKAFSCRLQIPGDDEGKLIDSTRLVVLVAPSTPVCKIEGTAEYGQNINLTCRSEEGSPPPVYSWKQSDVRHTPRIPDPRTTDKGGILSLYNISMETSGYYNCTSRNKIRAASCNITLTVLPPSMNMGATAGLIGGGVALLLVLGIGIYCCCCRKKKGKEEEYTMGAPESGEFHEKEPVANGQRDRRDEERSEAGTARRSEYDDRRSDYDDNRSDYTARRSDYDDRRSDFDDRRSDYADRRDRHDDDRRRDDDRRYDDDRRRDDDRRYDDDRRRDDDRADHRRDDDRYDEPYDDMPARPKPPSVPNNKPPRGTYDD